MKQAIDWSNRFSTLNNLSNDVDNANNKDCFQEVHIEKGRKKGRQLVSLNTLVIFFILAIIILPYLGLGSFVFSKLSAVMQTQLDKDASNNLKILDKNITQVIDAKLNIVSTLSGNLNCCQL